MAGGLALGIAQARAGYIQRGNTSESVYSGRIYLSMGSLTVSSSLTRASTGLTTTHAQLIHQGDDMRSTHAGIASAGRYLPSHGLSAFSLARLCAQIPPRALRIALLAVLPIFTTTVMAAQSVTDEMDRSIKPGDDFYRYANGGWLRSVSIPAGQSSYDNRLMLTEKNKQRVQDIVHEASTARSVKGSVSQKVGDYYAGFMDQDVIEAKKLAPVTEEMARISAIADKQALSAYLGTTLNSEVDGLISNSDHVFGMWVNQGFQDPEHNIVHLWQGGLGMLDHANYTDPSPEMAKLRNQYQAHIATLLKMAGLPDAEARAARTMALEIGIAQAFPPDADAADVFKQNNPWKTSEFATKAPGMDWGSYFKAAGLSEQPYILVWQPSAVVGVSARVASESIDTGRDYLDYHLIEH
jgi:putative endopeptidase